VTAGPGFDPASSAIAPPSSPSPPAVPLTPGSHRWSASTGQAVIRDVAATWDGFVVGGSFRDTADLPFEPRENVVGFGSNDALLSRIGPGRRRLWCKVLGDAGDDSVSAVAVGRDGTVYGAGAFQYRVFFGGPVPMISGGKTDAFLAAYAADGSLRWSRQAGGKADDGASFLALSPAGVLMSGHFRGRANVGATQLDALGEEDVFVAAYDDQGTLAWARSLGTAKQDEARGLVALPDGGSALLARRDFEPHTLGPEGCVLVGLSARGETLWTRSLEGMDGRSIALAASGELIVGGTCGETTCIDRYSASGVPLERRPLASVGPLEDLVVGPDGTTYAVIRHAVFGKGYTRKGDDTIALFALSGAATARWSREHIATGWGWLRLALTPTEGLVGVGDFEGAVDAGGGPLERPEDEKRTPFAASWAP
jgi:outer membrane protein assembly factor BamB